MSIPKPVVLVVALLLIAGTLLLVMPRTAVADGTLPPATWYAVVWQQNTNSLHWINANGEQASIPRPRLQNEASATSGVRLHISPNGRYLVVMAPLLDGREGIGFFDLQTGYFLQTHQTEPNEVFMWNGYYPSTISSTHFAVSLRNNTTTDWRIIAFELASGNVVAQLTNSDPTLPGNMPLSADWWPVVAHYDLDEGLGQTRVRFQMVTYPNAPDTTFPSFMWYPETTAIGPDALPFSMNTGFDIMPASGQVVYAWYDGNPPTPTATNTLSTQVAPNYAPVTVFVDGTAAPRYPRWLRGGQWIGYRTETGPYQPHWVITTPNGQNSVPLSPEIGSLYATADGFLAVDSINWRLMHMTTYPVEAFATSFGTTVFQGQPFTVIYTTPAEVGFSLPQVVEQQPNPGVNAAVGDAVQAPDQPV
ncbi:MAG: hypothetical protein GYB65_19350, partial [Chloroflexi bacterium]|nr:hypothetical protein [Chloroflexota bacterium]